MYSFKTVDKIGPVVLSFNLLLSLPLHLNQKKKATYEMQNVKK